MTLLEVVGIGAVVLLAATLQTAVGFGLGLVAVPLFVSSGRTLPEAVSIALGAGFVQSSYGAWTMRAEIDRALAFRFALLQCLALPFGVRLMIALADAGPAYVKSAVGLLVLSLLVVREASRPAPKSDVGRGWGFVAATTSGLLSGISGMGGPPLVLFALAHAWTKERFRAFLWTQFMLVAPVLALVLLARAGAHLGLFVLAGCATAPIVFVGARLGLAITARWPAERVHRAAIVMLVAIAVQGLAAPFFAAPDATTPELRAPLAPRAAPASLR